MKQGPFRILSIDGGGIRGVFPAHILYCISEKLGISLHDKVDLIAGTSTGAIVAAAIACEIAPEKIKRLYYEKGAGIFESKWSLIPSKFLQTLTHGLYNSSNLKRILAEVFGDIRLGDVKIPLLLPASDIGLGGVHVFKSSYSPDFTRDKETLVRDAVLASCAAPTFFNPAKVGPYLLADGGLWANNPTLAAIIDAQYRLNIQFENIHVLSVGTGHAKKYYGTKDDRWWGFMFGWGGRKFIDFLLSLQALSTNNYAQLMLQDRLLRLDFESDMPLPLDDCSANDDLIARADKEFTYRSTSIINFFK